MLEWGLWAVPSLKVNDNGSFFVFFVMLVSECVPVGVWCRVVVLGR